MSSPPPPSAAPLAQAPRTYAAIVWGQLKKRPTAIASLVVIVLLALAGTFAPFLVGEVPLRWVEGGRASWPIFRYLTPMEYAAIFAFALALGLPVTARLVGRRARAAGASPLGRAALLHLAAWVLAALTLMATGQPERRYGFYLERASEADAAWFPLVAYPARPGYAQLEFKEQPPSWKHPLGTGRLGDDVLVGVLYGTRTAMTIGFVAVGISLAIGVVLGAASGYAGGRLDLVLMRLCEIFMFIPRLVLIIVILTVVPSSFPPIWAVVLVLGVTGWTQTYRLMRAELLRIRTEDYMVAARGLGIPTWRLLVRHAIPNGMGPVLVGVPFGIAGAIFIESSLAFLNLVQTPSWGTMLNDAVQHLEYWWIWVSAGTAIFVTVLAYNLLGEGIRDAIDPRLKI
jgi:peptide/nickel transport system permease protein